MKKMKKVFAMLLALAMVLGMSITAFAEQNATITVNGLEDGAELSIVQIIAPAPTEATGWAFTEAGKPVYNSLKGSTTNTEQDIIQDLIDNNVSASDYETALNAAAYGSGKMNVNGTTATYPVSGPTAAGVYAIKGKDKTNPGETQIVYSPMAAYVSFGAYDKDTGAPADLVSPDPINAKKTEKFIDKTAKEPTVGVGDTIPYSVNTVVPYIPDSVADGDVVFTIKDSIEGATYLPGNGKVAVEVKVDGVVDTTITEVEVKDTTNGEMFSLDLKSIAMNRANANKKLTVSYSAVAITTIVKNTATSEVTNQDDITTGEYPVYTGEIQITKYGKEVDGKKAVLENAGFVVRKEATGEYAVVSGEKGSYEVVRWTSEAEAKGSDDKFKAEYIVTTDAAGVVKVKGVDDNKAYAFKEVVAPEGYSLNGTDSTISADNKSETNITGWEGAADARKAATIMEDTQLSALPETGGIGTTIFTIGGCLIMIAAAGLFFASRRKSAK